MATQKRDELNFSTKEILIGTVETVTKALLAVLVWLGTNLQAELKNVSNQGHETLNKVTEINAKIDNNTKQIDRNTNSIKDLEKDFYKNR